MNLSFLPCNARWADTGKYIQGCENLTQNLPHDLEAEWAPRRDSVCACVCVRACVRAVRARACAILVLRVLTGLKIYGARMRVRACAHACAILVLRVSTGLRIDGACVRACVVLQCLRGAAV